MSLAPDDPRHGTETGYTYHRCRCDPCREAHRCYHRNRRGSDARDGRLAVTCWCEATVVYVHPEALVDGVTAPCREPRCRAMHADARRAAA